VLKPPDRKKSRKPNRNKKPTASISVRWGAYDQLDALATAYNMSLGMTVEALLEEHHLNRGNTDES
jgi:hypothetical protein